MSLLNFFANTAAKRKLNFELNEYKLLPNETPPNHNNRSRASGGVWVTVGRYEYATINAATVRTG